MVQIRLASGALLPVNQDELRQMVAGGKLVIDLKHFIAAQTGYSIFRQRLFGEHPQELQEDLPLTDLQSVQLVFVGFVPADGALLEACRCQQLSSVREVERLLQRPHDPNDRGAGRLAPIHYAAGSGNFEVVQLLLEAGADKNATKPNGETALHAAAEKGHHEVARVLLEAGANKDAADMRTASTALHLAARYGHYQVVQRLLEAQANTDAADS